MNPGFVYFYQKCYMYVCSYSILFQLSVQYCAVQCSVYYLWKIFWYKYFIFKLRSFIDTDTFSQVLTFVLSTKVGDFPRIAFPRSLRKKQSLPLIQSKHSWFYLDRHIIFKMSAGKIVNASKGLFLIWYHNPRPLFDL